MKYVYITKSFTDMHGVRHKVRGKTEAEAIAKLERLKIQIERGEQLRSSSTFKKWAESALDMYKPNVSRKYLDCMRSRLRKHILPVIGHLPVVKVRPIQCQQIMINCAEMSGSTIRKIAQELFFYFDTARKNGMIIKNPAEEIVRPKGHQNKRRSLTPEERKHFLKVAEKEPRFVLFKLMLFCGCRPAEAYAVRYEDVTEIGGIKFLHIHGTKTENSDRLVPIPKEMLPVLTAAGKGYVAVTVAGNRHTETSYRRLSERLKREMNISMGCKVVRNQLIDPLPLADDFVPYFFRHTYCTDLKKMGVDLRIAKDLMGHADIKTTANIYDHDDNETLLLAARQMGLVS